MSQSPHIDSNVRDLLDNLRNGRRVRLPKGVTMYRRRTREAYDRAIFIFKSRGRTGAAMRYALQQAVRHAQPLLAKRERRP